MSKEKEIKFIKENQGGVLLNDYDLNDLLWFMEEYGKEMYNDAIQDCLNIDLIDKESILKLRKE